MDVTTAPTIDEAIKIIGIISKSELSRLPLMVEVLNKAGLNLTEIQDIMMSSEEYSIKKFLESKNSNEWIQSSVLYEEYKKFCETNNLEVLNIKRYSIEIQKYAIKKKTNVGQFYKIKEE